MLTELVVNGETLREWICDAPNCGNVAEHVVGFVRHVGAYVLCASCYRWRTEEGARR